MRLAQLNNQVSVSDQITVDDLPALKEYGIELLVCNRPDGEDEGQTPYEEIKAAADNMGFDTRLLAFSSYQITTDDRDRLIELLELDKKTHLYCRSGSRSRRLWRTANKIGCGGHGYVDAAQPG